MPESKTTKRPVGKLTSTEAKLVADVLVTWFPWLKTEEELQSCADQVESMNFLYEALREREAKR